MPRPRSSGSGGGQADPAESRPTGPLPYVPGLDGLRGLAVLAVLAYHLDLPFAPRGGAVGVTLFFTLSGYLITTLLLREVQASGGVRLGAFYGRRALRLLPALLLLAAAVAAYSRWSPPPASAEANNAALPYVLLYAANWYRAVEGFQSMGLLEHTWTLAVEEQFYLLWPAVVLIALALVARTGAARGADWRRGLLGVALVGSVAPLIVRLAIWDGLEPSAARVLNGTDTAADPLMMGCALAIGLALLGGVDGLGRGAARMRRALQVAVWPAAALLIADAVLRLDGRDPERIPITLLLGPTLIGLAGTVVVGWTVLRSPAVLAWRPLRAVGIVSYGLYLWHYPIILALREQRPDLGGARGTLLAVALSAVVTVLSYLLLERPVLRLRRYVRPGGGPPVRSGSREPVPVAIL